MEHAHASGSPVNGRIPPVIVRRPGLVDYASTLDAMQQFTATRHADSPDEIWLLEHPPVYTVGIAGRPEHYPRANNGIPVVKIDRGGQITYHGPGQIVAYLLLDMRRRNLSVRPLVRLMEQSVVSLLASHGIEGQGRAEAPGVYVGKAKIAAVGLRIRRGCCYHGLSLNVDLDLAPFSMIDPCGYPGLTVTRTRDLGIPGGVAELSEQLLRHLLELLR